MITRQGSNAIHGSVSVTTQPTLLLAPTYPIFSGKPVVGGTTITNDADTNVQAGAPIIKDRVWL